jgi:glutathione S-transferase
MTTPPTLYTFRRCPYAIRARMAIAISGVQVQHIEVELRNKPKEMLDASPKGTVPVLRFPQPEGGVIDQSLDIMRWALQINDPERWLCANNDALSTTLITANDTWFKQALDKYKYASKHPERSAESYRADGECFLSTLEDRITQHPYLLGNHCTLADIAIFPFIRQFAHVDKAWFESAPYPHLQRWLSNFLESELFHKIMEKK